VTDRAALETEEVEVTPEMVAAGSEVLWRSFGDSISWGSDSARGIAIEVFRAMAEAAQS
jgi:hypothetical protein